MAYCARCNKILPPELGRQVYGWLHCKECYCIMNGFNKNKDPELSCTECGEPFIGSPYIDMGKCLKCSNEETYHLATGDIIDPPDTARHCATCGNYCWKKSVEVEEKPYCFKCYDELCEDGTVDPESSEAVDHPQHYNNDVSGVECIDVIEDKSFNIGNAIKYLWRAGNKGKLLEDLKKARWYVNREIERLEHGPKTYSRKASSHPSS